MSNQIKVMLEEDVTLPEFESKLAAGFDIRGIKILAAYKGDKNVSEKKLSQMNEGFTKRQFIKIRAFERVLFGTGLRVQLPEDMELQVRPRSGMTLKKGLTVLNSPGTIDADYRGEIGIILYNSSPFMTEVKFNERIAQLVPKTTVQPELVIEKELSTTERGEGGFGSTGDIDSIKACKCPNYYTQNMIGQECGTCGEVIALSTLLLKDGK